MPLSPALGREINVFSHMLSAHTASDPALSPLSLQWMKVSAMLDAYQTEALRKLPRPVIGRREEAADALHR